MYNPTTNRLLMGAAGLLGLCVFAIDAFTPLDFAIAVVYVLVILLVALTGSIRATRITAGVAMVLTVVAFVGSQSPDPDHGQLARFVFALLAIGTTTLLALRNLADMARRRHTEAALARSEAFLAEAQRLTKTGSIALRLPSNTMTWSDEAFRILGYPRGEAPHFGMVLTRVHPDDLAEVQRMHAAMLGGVQSVDLRHRLLMPDGAVRHVHLVARLSATAGDQHEYVGALMDTTDATATQQALHRTMAELAHVSRVTTLGQLAASIAHEVTQPMAAIVTCGSSALRWLQRDEPEIAEATESIEQVIRDASRANDIIRQIRAMAQKSEPKYVDIGVDRLVTASLELVRRELQDHQVSAELDLDADAAQIHGDWTQLQQVLVNLMVNAAQAMSQVPGRRRLTLASRIMPDRTVLLVVTDTGPGIPDKDMDRLFNAFYTTKPDGMGMGLSICRNIVESHGGSIAAESPPEGGAKMIVRLPQQVADGEHEAERAA
ncbi:ATP-binding protein [Cupriavidus sp.]|uniref:sensor histidine kinase n=1 Tax=Cupriavidus sp. TaxID=1873897 RepID=UPI0025C03512|nr:ATP-binding protein [Cupriavidus sp.]MCA3190801.1 PAS domain-containing protein [Cupriavidus sp.]MCA3199112.1 PAS domain-containing protein [Cupriavidus sp.]MCA3205049.1 PAS domain-containing protein [Cupriavidus sp.]MCA3209120.1 PAS domain-containing protein [Cupriavidus sp.]